MSSPTLPIPTGAPRRARESEGAPCCRPSRVPRAIRRLVGLGFALPGSALPCPALPCLALPCPVGSHFFGPRLLRSGLAAPCTRRLREARRAEGTDPRPGPGRLVSPPPPKCFPPFSTPGLVCRDPGRWHALLSLTCAPGIVVGRRVAESLSGRCRPFSNSSAVWCPPRFARRVEVGKPLFALLCDFPCRVSSPAGDSFTCFFKSTCSSELLDQLWKQASWSRCASSPSQLRAATSKDPRPQCWVGPTEELEQSAPSEK